MTTGALSRLRGRSARELRDRAVQAVAKTLERWGLGDVGEPVGRRLALLIGPEPAGAVVRGPFFASLDDRDATIAALRSVAPDFEARLRARADRIVAGCYDLLGHRDLSFGTPVDWWLDPISGVRAPDSHWSRIAYLDAAVVGDHKLVWELGRHQGLVVLGQAWWCTRDRRYAEAATRLIASWLDMNPPKRGLHWASSLELAFRAMAWVWTLALLGETLPPALRRRALGHLAITGRHIERNLSTWFSPNTHLTGEALGLFMLGTALPQCRDASRWRSRGASILLEWLPRHVRPDGTYVEQSTWYHRYTTDFYLHFLILAERSGLDIRQRVAPAVGGLLDVLAWVSRPDGTMPLIGDDDGGRLLFLDEATAHRPRNALATGAALLERSDLAAVAGAPTPELVWLLGAGGVSTWRSLTPRPPAQTSRRFADGGLIVLRDGWSGQSSVMTIDAGPHGFLNAGHAHADALSLDLAVHGEPLLIDPGTFTYTCDPDARDAFRHTAAHNAATVDGLASARPSGPFSWASRAEAACDVWFQSGPAVLVSATHDGFSRSPTGVSYRRSVVFVLPALWIVRDEITGDGAAHELTAHWQCAPDVHPIRDGNGWVLRRRGAPVASLQAIGPARCDERSSSVSAAYGVSSMASRLTVSMSGSRHIAVTTILTATGSPAVAEPMRDGLGDDSFAATIRWGSRTGIVVAGAVRAGGVDLQARLGWIELQDAARARWVVAAGASHLSVGGRAIRGDGDDTGVHWIRDEGASE